MVVVAKSRSSCGQIPSVRSASLLTNEELEVMSQDDLSDLTEQLNIEIRIAEKEYSEANRKHGNDKRIFDSIFKKFPWSDDLKEMELDLRKTGYDTERIREEVCTLRHYRERIKKIWRTKAGLR